MNSIQELTKKILEFRNARDWEQYHTPKNLALSLIVEIGELFELIQWQTNNEIKEEINKIKDALSEANLTAADIAGLGIATQRATFTLWNKETGEPLYNFISWQDIRTGKTFDR